MPTYSYAQNKTRVGNLSNRTNLEAIVYGTPEIHVYYKETTDGALSNGKRSCITRSDYWEKHGWFRLKI